MAYCIFLPNKKLFKTLHFFHFKISNLSSTVYTWITLKRYKFIHVGPKCSES